MRMRIQPALAGLLLLLSAISVMAQSPADVEVSDPQFVYDANARLDTHGRYEDRRAVPLTTVTDSPVQQVSALFRNVGAKPIKSINWEYAVYRDASETDVLRLYSVRSKVSLLPGQALRLARTGYHLKHSQYEKARVTRIEYADGSVWQLPKADR